PPPPPPPFFFIDTAPTYIYTLSAVGSASCVKDTEREEGSCVSKKLDECKINIYKIFTVSFYVTEQ
ncbi:hypothetical protein, partial [Bacillus cereus]|uniref:hypothetical protein n=1 Tax=Bacillus cereus TaxID=1396 RepID=UPI0021127160